VPERRVTEMYLYLAVGLIVTVLLSLFCFFSSANNCLDQLRENMPLNEWVSFDEAVKISRSWRWIVQLCLFYLSEMKIIEARPGKELEEKMRKRVEKILESVPEEQKKAGVIVVIHTGFRHISGMEFLLRVRPNAQRKVEKKVEVPDFALPQGI